MRSKVAPSDNLRFVRLHKCERGAVWMACAALGWSPSSFARWQEKGAFLIHPWLPAPLTPFSYCC